MVFRGPDGLLRGAAIGFRTTAAGWQRQVSGRMRMAREDREDAELRIQRHGMLDERAEDLLGGLLRWGAREAVCGREEEG